MDQCTELCPAKINLGLIIKGKRPDGYHLLQTLFYPVPSVSDQVTVSVNGRDDCEVQMQEFEEQIPLHKNLCYRAWELMRQQWPAQVRGVTISVHKKIPAGAGLAGGSSDAAGVMRAVNRLFSLGQDAATLAALGARLGADVPFFFFDQPMFAEGIGEILSPWPVDLSAYELRLFTPPLHSSTPDAFRALDWSLLRPGTELRDLLRLPITEWKDNLRNDLETPVFNKFPLLMQQKLQFYADGAVYASMTGSGSGIFALFART